MSTVEWLDVVGRTKQEEKMCLNSVARCDLVLNKVSIFEPLGCGAVNQIVTK